MSNIAQLKRQATINASVCLDVAREHGNVAYRFITKPEQVSDHAVIREEALECIHIADKAIEYAEQYRTRTAQMYARQARMTRDGAEYVLRKLDEAGL